MKILQEVVSLPTAPFNEQIVAKYVIEHCVRHRVKTTIDKWGNIVAHIKKGTGAQPVAFTSHMDHPGVTVLSVKGNKATVGILGGINLDYFKGASLAIKTSAGIVRGRVVKALSKKWMKKPAFEVIIKKDPQKVAKGDFGWLDLVPFKKSGDIIYTKSADNTASVALLLELAVMLKKKKGPFDVYLVFTRAEEVGFVGCSGLAEDATLLPKNAIIVVTECSSYKSGNVKVGGGPVIRVGDKLLSYHPTVDFILKATAERLAKKDKTFKYQRALLSGGTCEASVWGLKGRLVGGLAFPLGNYHNNGDKGYAPEYISAKDYKGMLKLLIAVATAKISELGEAKDRIGKIFLRWKKYL